MSAQTKSTPQSRSVKMKAGLRLSRSSLAVMRVILFFLAKAMAAWMELYCRLQVAYGTAHTERAKHRDLQKFH
jgi:hypothetical protein